MTNLRRTVAPTTTIIDLTTAKLQLGIDGTSWDTLISAILETATQEIEIETNQIYCTQTWAENFRCLSPVIPLSKSPIVSAVVTYDGQTVNSSNYLIVNTPKPCLVFREDFVIPDTTDEPDSVTVTYVCGGAIPAVVKGLCRELVAEKFANRGDKPASPNYAHERIRNYLRRSSPIL